MYKATKIHGDSVASGDRRLYRLYHKMLDRCYNPKQNGYSRYGGKGITVCQEWLDDYVNFRSWAYRNKYYSNLSLDRIDSSTGYCPENCRWVEVREQSRNRIDSVKFNGECATDASFRLGGTKNLVNNRLRLGWDKKKAFTVNARLKNNMKTI